MLCSELTSLLTYLISYLIYLLIYLLTDLLTHLLHLLSYLLSYWVTYLLTLLTYFVYFTYSLTYIYTLLIFTYIAYLFAYLINFLTLLTYFLTYLLTWQIFARRHFFSERVIDRWNRLPRPQHVINSASLNAFKSGLDRLRSASIDFFTDQWSAKRTGLIYSGCLESGAAAPGMYLVCNNWSENRQILTQRDYVKCCQKDDISLLNGRG